MGEDGSLRESTIGLWTSKPLAGGGDRRKGGFARETELAAHLRALPVDQCYGPKTMRSVAEQVQAGLDDE